MIDLRKAFDVVDHNLLLKKLQIYGLNSNSLKWFGSYLSRRYQKVCVDGKLSEPLGIQSGVPQGSILGPALFLLFINDLPLVLKNNIGIYADDSTLYASAPTLADIEEKTRPDIDAASKWVKENKMKIHQAKTKYSIISTRQKIANSPKQTLDLSVDGMQLTKVESERVLGVYIDSHLTWNEHIDILRRKLLQRISILGRARKYLPIKYRLLLYNACIKPLFTYCCTVWSNCSQTNLDELFKLQRRCARLILDSPWDARSFDNFQKLKWLPIDQMFKINKLGLLKKVIDGRAPEYLTASLDTLRFEHNYPTRAKTSYRLPKPRTEAMRRTFFYSAIKDFNAVNLNPTASFNSIKATMINNTAPIYTVHNFKVKKLF